MPTSRVIPKKVPICPGRDSKFTIKHNRQQGNAWWIYYIQPQGDPVPADDAHADLVLLVNSLKQQEGQQPGGAFSINEHFQVIARMGSPRGYPGQAIHVIGLNAGTVVRYSTPITFARQTINPTVTPKVGAPWPGPLCGSTYSFAARGNPKPPSNNYDEVWTEIDGRITQLSTEANVVPYPPSTGALAGFLAELRNRLPSGGKFRVNEHGRAFTSDTCTYIGCVPLAQWFKPLTAKS
jgi:hypothetical protein